MTFSKKIGLKAEWLQKSGRFDEHFSLTPGKRAVAVRNGAVEIESAHEITLKKNEIFSACIEFVTELEGRTGRQVGWIAGGCDCADCPCSESCTMEKFEKAARQEARKRIEEEVYDDRLFTG
jgi:hypothetical protein